MICDLCSESFEPTPENPGTTAVGGMREADQVVALHLCHQCVAGFHALPPDTQYAQALAILAAHQDNAI